MLAVSESIPWPTSVDILCQSLNIKGATSKVPCHGKNKQNLDCRSPISRANSDNVKAFLAEIVLQGNLASARDLLRKTSDLSMCHYHKAQSLGLLKRWENILEKIETPVEADTNGLPQQQIAAGVLVKLENVCTVIKTEDQMSEGVKDEPMALNDIPMNVNHGHNQDQADHTITIAKKESFREKSKTNASKPSHQAHKFIPFSAHTSTQKINKTIHDKILTPLLAGDLQKQRVGSIYIYTFPALYRHRTPYLKIGHTNNVTKRMERWSTRCGYPPKLLSDHSAEFYVRVERLVHLQLRNQRIREATCPGCGHSHIEWFKTTLSKAASIIALWTNWTRQEPYDEHGELKEQWRRRLEAVDLDDEGCWDKFVYGDDEDEEHSDDSLSDYDNDHEFEYEYDDDDSSEDEGE